VRNTKRDEEKVRVGEDLGGVLDGEAGLPAESLLFNILMADLEEEMGRVKWGGGMKLGERRVYSFSLRG